MKLTEIEKARRVIERHEATEREAKRLKPGEVRYGGFSPEFDACTFYVRPSRALSPDAIAGLIRGLPEFQT